MAPIPFLPFAMSLYTAQVHGCNNNNSCEFCPQFTLVSCNQSQTGLLYKFTTLLENRGRAAKAILSFPTGQTIALENSSFSSMNHQEPYAQNLRCE